MDRTERDAPTRLGEVVESASQGFTAQCYHLYQSPHLGTLVKASSPETYAVVSRITTASLFPGRPVLPRGEEEETEEEVYRANPQLDRLLCTRFEATVLGHEGNGLLRQALPPLPPRIHAFVYCCTQDEVQRFTSSLDFLWLLLGPNTPNGDEVVAAFLIQASAAHEDTQRFLTEAGRALAFQLGTELPRLNALLRRISP